MRNNSDNKKSYAEKLKDPRWQKKRLEILKRDRFKCRLCGDDKISLQVHHKSYLDGKEPWEYQNTNFITLCAHCHFEIGRIIEKVKGDNRFPKDFEIPYANTLIMKSAITSDGSQMMVSFPGYLIHDQFDENGYEKSGWIMTTKGRGKQFLKLVKNSFSGKL